MTNNILAEALKQSPKKVLQEKNLTRAIILDSIRDQQLQQVLIALLDYDIPMQLLPIINKKDLRSRAIDICNHLAQQCPYKESVIRDALATWIRALKDDSFVLDYPETVIHRGDLNISDVNTTIDVTKTENLQETNEIAKKRAIEEARRQAESARIKAEDDARNAKIESALYDICRKKGKSMEENGPYFDDVIMELKVRGVKDEDVKKYLERKTRGERYDITLGKYAYSFIFYSGSISVQKRLSEQGEIKKYKLKESANRFSNVWGIAMLVVWAILLIINSIIVYVESDSWWKSILAAVVTFFAFFGEMSLVEKIDENNPIETSSPNALTIAHIIWRTIWVLGLCAVGEYILMVIFRYYEIV